jgi:hypothetical protein
MPTIAGTQLTARTQTTLLVHHWKKIPIARNISFQHCVVSAFSINTNLRKNRKIYKLTQKLIIR